MAGPTLPQIIQPLINGVYPTHSELTVLIQPLGSPSGLSTVVANGVSAVNQVTGLQLKGQLGIRELSYGDQMPPNLVYANDAAPIGRTRGQYSANASMAMLLPQYYAFIAALKASALGGGPNVGYGEIAFDISAQYLMSGFGASLVQAQLIGCRIGHVSTSSSAGSQDPISKTMDLNPMYIIENGQLLFSGNVAQSQTPTPQ